MKTRAFAYRNRTWFGVFEIAFGAVTIALNARHLAAPGRHFFAFLPLTVDKAVSAAMLIFGVSLILYGIWLIVQHLRPPRSVTLMPDRILVPSGFSQADAEIPYRSIRGVRVVSILWQKHLEVQSERGSVSINDYLLSGRASFQELADGLSDRVDAARRAGGDTTRSAALPGKPGSFESRPTRIQ